MNNNNHKYWEKPIPQVLTELKAKKNGLSPLEARRRLFVNGRNEIKNQNQRGAFSIFLSQFKNPLVLILLVASVLAGFLGDIISTIIIILIIITSAFLAFFQEYKSEQIIAKLRKKVSLKISVLREGKIISLLTTELVTGDIVLLELGKVVPADLRLIDTDDLLINEAILTGESFPVEKTAINQKVKYYLPQSMKNLAFMGTHVVQGSGRGVVIATGKNTELGKTAHLLQTKPEQTEFQKGIASFGIFLFKIILIFSLSIFLFLAVFKHDWVESLLFALAIAVGISPELLPVIITLNLSRGAQKMSKKQVIVKRLMSIEDLGNTDILCTDKTGTLTAGNITLKDYFDFDRRQDQTVLTYSLLCNTFTVTKNISGNPLDEAIFDYGKQNHLRHLIKDYKIIDSLSFDFDRRRMSVIAEDKTGRQLICKGAIEEMLTICDRIKIGDKTLPFKTHRARAEKEIKSWQNQGFKILLIASRKIEAKNRYSPNDEEKMTLLGYLIFSDSLKKTSKETLLLLQKLGVTVKVLTGDNEPITRYILREVGFEISGVLSGSQLDKMTAAELNKIVDKVNVFIRITPEHKLKIVNALKENKHTVSFLGDGANDAPALRAADVGISVDSAVDIAKEAADVILMQKSLSVLAEGITEGRKTFGNTLKYIFCTISSNYGNMFSVAGAALILPFIPMLPVQILLLNFLSDFPMLAISTDNVDDEYLQKPKHWDIKVISRFMTYFGLISSVFDFLTFGFLLYLFGRVAPMFQAGWFWESFLTEVLLIFVIRTKKFFWQSKPSRSVIIATIITTILVLFFLYTPVRIFFHFAWLPFWALIMIVGIALAYFLLVEFAKERFYRKFEI